MTIQKSRYNLGPGLFIFEDEKGRQTYTVKVKEGSIHIVHNVYTSTENNFQTTMSRETFIKASFEGIPQEMVFTKWTKLRRLVNWFYNLYFGVKRNDLDKF